MAVTRIKNNQITDATVNAAAKLQDYSITSGKIANNLTYNSSLTIAGNLTVQGNVTAIDTTDLVVEDPLILLAKDQSGPPTLDIGFIGKRGTANNIAFIWDESAGEFATIYTTSEVTNTVVTISQYASLHSANILAANVTVTDTITANVQTANNFTVTQLTANNINTDTLETTGNAVIGGNLTVEGNLTYININDLRVEDPIIILGTGPNGAPLTQDDNLDRGIYMEYYTTGLGNAFFGWQNSSGNLIIADNVSFSGNDVISVSTYGTLNVGNSYHESATIEGNLLARGSGTNFRVTGGGSQGNLLVTDTTANVVMIKTGTPVTGAALAINSADSLLLPTGNNAQRPGSPVTGMFRFNTTIDAIEYYSSTAWESVQADFTVITYDEFTGDGSQVAFNLSESITTAAALVSINGVVQLPFTAYSITGNVLTFTEAPLSSDTIDVRLITTTAEITSLANPSGTASLTADQNLGFFTVVGNIIPTPDNTYSLGNATNRWSKGWFAANSVVIGNIAISESGNVLTVTNIVGNAVVPIGTSTLQNGTSNVTIPAANGNVIINSGGSAVATFASSLVAVTGNVNATSFVASANSVAGQMWVGTATQWLADEGEAAQNRLTLAVGNVAGPIQTGIVNLSNGALAYSEFIAINDTGNTEQGWISVGVNSSLYNDPAFLLTGADDGYLLYEAPTGSAGSGNLVIATGANGANNAIVFGAGGFATGNTQMTINPDQNVHIEIPVVSTSPSTGALTVVGGVGVQGNVSIGGNLNLSLTSTATGNNFNANEHVWSGDVAQWLIDQQESDTGRRIAAVANIAGPAETLTVNRSADPLAYSEFISVNDLGNISAGWISVGINSSTYNDPGFLLTGADDGYLLFETNTSSPGAGNLVIATGSNGNVNAIVFGAGGFATGNTQMAIIPDQEVRISIPTESTSTGTGALVVTGGIGLTGNLNVGGSVNIVGNITLGGTGNTIDVSALAVDDPLIYMGANNAADLLDLGFAGEYKVSNVATYAGLVRDASDGSFRFFANVQPKPTSTVDFASANLVYPTLYTGNLQLTSNTVATNSTTGALVVGGGAGIGGALFVSGTTQFSGNTTAGNLAATSVTVSGGASITGGNLSVTNTTIVNTSGAVIAIQNGAANGVGNIGSSSGYFNTVFAKATSAQYADLAEVYEADNDYEPGTVMIFGGAKEVTMSTVSSDTRVAGVVSTNPSYIMNAGQTGKHTVTVALTGRVPTRVSGPVRKGDMMVSAGDGSARACAAPQIGTVIGKALQDHDGLSGIIEVVVGRL